MWDEGVYEGLSLTAKEAWARLSEEELTEAALVEQVAAPATTPLYEGFLTAINTHNTPASQVRVILDGVRVPPYHYSTNKNLKIGHYSVLDRASLSRYFQRGATVMIDDAQTAIPLIDRLCTDLTAYSGIPVAGTIFASPSHAEGFALHQDAEDVIIIQVAGAKSWTIFPRLERTTSSMLNRSECGDPIMEAQLRAGDILLLPKGSPHKTESNSADGSVHLTLGFYPVTLRDALVKLIEVSTDRKLDDPVPCNLEEMSRVASSVLAATVDANSLSKTLEPIVDELRARLRGDTNEFQLPTFGFQPEGGTYRLLTRVSSAMRQFLAAQLSRPDDEQLNRLFSVLEIRVPGDTFTYREFVASTLDSILAEEALHAMLRMRFIGQCWPEERVG